MNSPPPAPPPFVRPGGGPGSDDPQLWEVAAEHSPVGTCLASADGVVELANPALAAMLGRSVAELRGTALRGLVHPEDRAADEAFLDAMLRGERPTYRRLMRLQHAGGEGVWGDLSVTVLRDDDGAPEHLVVQVLDITEHHLERAELTRAVAAADLDRRRGEEVLDTVDVGLVLLDHEGRFDRVNRRQQAIVALAYPDGHDGVAGQCGEIYHGDGTLLTRTELPCARAARGEEFHDQRMWVGADATRRRALSVSARAVPEARGAVLSYSDITDLMEALQSRETFVTSVSHELRSPLTVVVGHLEMLLEEGELPTAVTAQLEVAARSAVRLRSLVADLLDPATRTTGDRTHTGLVLACTPTDLTALTVEVVDSARAGAAEAEVDLAVDAPGRVQVVLDPLRAHQVVQNLVANALKYTDPGGRVDLRLRDEGTDAVLTVTDTGIGIAPDDVTQLFTPFFRSDPARHRVTPGLGLGLGIAHAIVQAHGGRLDVASELGRGSTFRVTLPVGGPDHVDDAAR